jgi:hypothetical protein
MSTSPEMSTILQELAAGRIDAAEAARRIDAMDAPQSTPTSSSTNFPPHSAATPAEDEAAAEPSNDELAGHDRPQDVWAEATDRPQHATYTTEPFAPASSNDANEAKDTKPASSTGTASDAPAAERGRSKPVNTGGVERISIRAVGRRVRVVGEPAVVTVSADGPHVLRRNGSVLEISSDGEMGASLDGFSILRATRSLDDIRSLGLGKELFLRVNPAIVVDAEVTAGSLSTEGISHLGKIRVTAGGAKLLDVGQIEDALIQAGQATIKGAFTTGRSRIRAESGSLSIQLADESNVTVTGESQLGKVSWSGGHTGAGDEVVMGNGSAKLDVEVVMGHAQVKVGSEPRAEAGSE